MALSYDGLSALIKAKHLPVLADNIFRKRMLLTMLKKKAQTFNGRKMVVPLEYAVSDQVQFTGEMGTFKLGTVDPVTAAEYTPSMLTATLTVSKEEELKCNTEDEVLSLANIKSKNLQKSIDKTVAERLWSRTAALANSWANIEGLLSASGTIGGIAVSDAAWWATPIYSAASYDDDATEANLLDSSKDCYIFKILQKGVANASNQTDENPDIIVMPQYIWDMIEFIYDQQKRTDKFNEKAANLGFKALDFRGIPIVPDKDMVRAQTGDTDGRIEFLNTDYLNFYFNSAAKFTGGKFLEPTNQNSRSMKVHAYGGMVTSNRQAHCRITNLPSPQAYGNVLDAI